MYVFIRENTEKVCKVDAICDAVRLALEAVDRSKWVREVAKYSDQEDE